MSDEKKYTERDLILAKREGAAFVLQRPSLWFPLEPMRYEPLGDAGARAEAAKHFPLPKVSRPRVVRDPHGFGYWTVGRDMAVRLADRSDDVFTSVIGQTPNDNARGVQWLPIHQYVTAERVKLWADLLDNPTELVEE